MMGSDSCGKPSAIHLQFWATTYDLFLDLFLAKLGWFLIIGTGFTTFIFLRATVGPCFLWPSGTLVLTKAAGSLLASGDSRRSRIRVPTAEVARCNQRVAQYRRRGH